MSTNQSNQLPLVSVCMLTYKHEPYIKEAIEGVLMQEVDFPVELIIADDNTNSDNTTPEIIEDCVKNHPNGSWVNYTRHQENKGMVLNFAWTLDQCQGKYIAICDGDDYWTDPKKLKYQVEEFEKHEEAIISYHLIERLYPSGTIKRQESIEFHRKFNNRANLLNINFLKTVTVMFRRSRLNTELLKVHDYIPNPDYYLYVSLLTHPEDKILFLDRCMATYRVGVPTSITSSQSIITSHYGSIDTRNFFIKHFNNLTRSEIKSINNAKTRRYLSIYKKQMANKAILAALYALPFAFIYCLKINLDFSSAKKPTQVITFNKFITHLKTGFKYLLQSKSFDKNEGVY